MPSCVLSRAMRIGLLFLLAVGASSRAWSEEATRIPAPVERATAESGAVAEHVFAKDAPETVAELRAIETRVRKLLDRLIKATVAVQIGGTWGSGVIVSEDGYVLTAAHVSARPGRLATLILSDGRRVRARTLGLDRRADAGLIRIEDKGQWPHVEMGDMDDVHVGDWCIALGHPGGYRRDRPPVLRIGRVIFRKGNNLQTDCTLVGGDSGGPLFDMQGRVIGIHSRIGTSTEWNFHVPIAAYSSRWDELVAAVDSEPNASQTPSAGRAVLGIHGEDDEQGCRVVTVLPGLPAERAGLREGDVIVRFDGQAVRDFKTLVNLIHGKKPGDEVMLSVLRNDQTVEAKVKLAERR